VADEVRDLIRDMDGIPLELRRELRPAIGRAGRSLLNAARLNASWSTRIPNATRLSIRFSRGGPGVSVITDGARAPHAPLYENQGEQGVFSHPLFGNRSHWYSQRARPFLGPALEAEGPQAFADVVDVVDGAIRNARFH
jgi:hypothetical protein